MPRSHSLRSFLHRFMKRPDVCFSSSPKSPERGKESTVLRHRHPRPGRSRRSGAAPRPRPGILAPGGNRSREQSSRSSQAGGSLPQNARPSLLPSLRPWPGERRGGRASGPGSPLPPPGGKRPARSLVFPLTPQFGPAATADLRQDFCSGREGKKL